RRLPVYLPSLELAQAHCFYAIGELTETEAHPQAECALGSQSNLVPIFWQAHQLLAALSYRQGQFLKAQMHQQEAANHARALAASIDDTRLRHTFLTTPAVEATFSS